MCPPNECFPSDLGQVELSDRNVLIHLSYSGVERYLFDAPNRAGDARFDHTAHGDLYPHEIRLVRDGVFVHEFVFERGGTLLVEFSGFSHREEMLKRDA